GGSRRSFLPPSDVPGIEHEEEVHEAGGQEVRAAILVRGREDRPSGVVREKSRGAVQEARARDRERGEDGERLRPVDRVEASLEREPQKKRRCHDGGVSERGPSPAE